MKKVRRIRKVKKEPQVFFHDDRTNDRRQLRTDWGDFLSQTDVLSERRPHHHFLVLVAEEGKVSVHVTDAARKLDRYPASSPVIVRWPGQWRSDWFKTTVGDLLAAREALQA